MALSWDITACRNHEELWSNENKSITEQLIWLMMATGIGEITVKNYADLHARIKVLEAMDGAYINKVEQGCTQCYNCNGEDTIVPYFYTVEDISRRIGINSNVTNEKFPTWFKRITKSKNMQHEKKYDETFLQAVYWAAKNSAEVSQAHLQEVS